MASGMGQDAGGIEALEAALAAAEARVQRLEAQLRSLADHDPLTDLRNRHSMEEAIGDHVVACHRYGPSGALLLLAVNGLDDVARITGGDGADDARVVIAEALLRRLRSTDVVARWAADEIAVLLPRAAQGEVNVVALALVDLVEAAGTDRVRPGTLSASIGAAFLTGDDHPDDLVVRASLAMLAARREGGSRLVVDSRQLARASTA